MTELALRLGGHRVRGVRVPVSGQLLLYATEALAVLLETTRARACRHYHKLARRAPELRHHGRPLGVCNHAQLFYRHGCETLATLDGLLRVAQLSRSPRALANRAAFVAALCDLFAKRLLDVARTISVGEGPQRTQYDDAPRGSVSAVRVRPAVAGDRRRRQRHQACVAV